MNHISDWTRQGDSYADDDVIPGHKWIAKPKQTIVPHDITAYKHFIDYKCN